MNRLFGDVVIGRKNMVAGIVLFLILGVVVGIPLTVDFLGGSLLTSTQYQSWKVIHGYSVFLAFINYFLGLSIDRFKMPVVRRKSSAVVPGGRSDWWNGKDDLVCYRHWTVMGRYAS